MKRPRNLRRKIGDRLPKKKIYIYSEGKNTEPRYFKAYERLIGSSTVEVVCEKERGVPKTMLELARAKLKEIKSPAYRRSGGDRDAVWLVFDQDDHEDVPGVIKKCREAGIGVAYSNPCFEVWLILHCQDYDRDEHRKKVQSVCEAVCVGYSKVAGKVPDYNDLLSGVSDAERRAEILVERREADGGAAPVTSVHELTAAIRAEEPKE